MGKKLVCLAAALLLLISEAAAERFPFEFSERMNAADGASMLSEEESRCQSDAACLFAAALRGDKEMQADYLETDAKQKRFVFLHAEQGQAVLEVLQGTSRWTVVWDSVQRILNSQTRHADTVWTQESAEASFPDTLSLPDDVFTGKMIALLQELADAEGQENASAEAN